MYQKAPKPRYNTLAAAMLLTALYMFQPYGTKAQVGIGTETPHPSAILDLVSTDKGLLISRVELRDLHDSRPIAEPVDGMLVWNTNRDLGIGFYFWSVADNAWYSLFSRQEYNQEAAAGITTGNITNWNAAHTHSTSTGNVHGSTTVGRNLYRMTNPGALSFLRVNADNTITARSAADFRSDIGAGTSDLALGETTTTAYQGDRGKEAYDHAQLSAGSVHGSTTVGGSLFRLTNPGTISFLRVNADNTVTARSAVDFRTDIGAGTSNLVLGETTTTAYRGDRGKAAYDHAQLNTGSVHGSTTVGTNMLRLANPGTVSFLRVNADNTVTARSAADFRTDIGAGTSNLALGETTTTAYQGDRGKAAYDHAQLNTGSVHGSTTVGTNMLRLANPGTVSFLRVNADNTVTARSATDFRSDIGSENIANKKTSLADNSDEYYPTQKAVKTALEEQNALLLAQIAELQIIAGIRIRDVDGNVYSFVTIGTQVWMTENLKTTKYNDGTDIPNVTDKATWAALTTPAFVWYNNNETTYKDTYGALYNWYTVSATTNGGKNICPIGWHVPTDAEWTQLIDYVVAQGYPNTNVVGGAGNALKSCRQVSSPSGGDCATSDHPRWNSHSTHYGTDTFGFSALPGGSRYSTGGFSNVANDGTWWSSTQFDATSAWYRSMSYDFGSVTRGRNNKMYGFSVRCVRDN